MPIYEQKMLSLGALCRVLFQIQKPPLNFSTVLILFSVLFPPENCSLMVVFLLYQSSVSTPGL